MKQKAAKFEKIFAFAAGKFDSQARLIARQILLAGTKFDEISVNFKRNFKKSYKGHIEDTKGHYNSPKNKGEKDERFCSNSRNYGYRSRALGLSNGSGGFVLTERNDL